MMNAYDKMFNKIKKPCSLLAAGAVLAGAVFGFGPLPAHTAHAAEAASAAVQLEADYGESAGPLIRTEQFNNTNYAPLPVHVVDALKNEIQTKIVRDFVKINWYYEKDAEDPDYLAWSIDDPRNDVNADLQHGRQETYDFMGQFSDSLLITLGYSYTSSKEYRNRLIKGQTEMDWEEFDKAMYKIIKVLKTKNPKLEYMQVGNEPNLEPAFYGHNHNTNVMDTSDESYMRMYKGMAEAVVRINNELGLDETFKEGAGKRLKVGGPVLSGYNESKLKEFIDVAAQENYQLDFVSWHRYQMNPSQNESQGITIRNYLDSKGLDDAIIIVSEYGWKGGGGLGDSTNNIALAKQAAFMTDAAYFFDRGGIDVPMNWVATHTLNAYFKNQFDVDYALSNGTTDWQEFESNYPGPVQYVNLRGWRESATTAGSQLKIQEIEFYDINNQKLDLSHLSEDPLIGPAIDGDENTQFEQLDYWTWLRFDFGAEYQIGKIRIKWGNAQVNKFQVIGTKDKLQYHELLGDTYFTPYFNTMRLLSRLGDEKVKTSGNETGDTGVRLQATKNSDSKLTMMVWNSQLDGTVAKDVSIDVKNLPDSFQGKTIRYQKYLVDATHSNYAYNKRDNLEIIDQGTLQAVAGLNFTQTLEPNAVMLIELEVVDSSINNIVSAFKTAAGLNHSEHLLDGDAATAAIAADSSYPREVTIDLGREFRLTGAEIKWTQALDRGFKYSIATSLNNGDYSVVLDKTGDYQFGNSLDWFGSNVKARYVRLTVDSATYDGPLSIDDVSIFAQALYENSFESAAEQAELSQWEGLGWSSKTTVWTTETVTGNTYIRPAETFDDSPNFGFFGDTDWQDYGIEARVKVADEGYSGNLEMGLVARAGISPQPARNNHYFFYLERSGTEAHAVLGKRVDGKTTVLQRLPFADSIDASRWYTLKLETVGQTVTGYVDGVKAVEATDSSRISGRAGLRGYRTPVQFDDVKVYPIMPLLSDIAVNGVSLPDFSPYKNDYLLKLPPGVGEATITAAVYGGASAAVHPSPGATLPLGDVGSEVTYTVAAKSNDGTGATFYRVVLRKANDDATLSSLRLSVVPDTGNYVLGEPVLGGISLQPNQYVYDVKVPSGTTYVSVLEAIPTISNLSTAQIDYAYAEGRTDKGTVTITVTAEAGNQQPYIINWEANPAPVKGQVLYEQNFEEITDVAQLDGWNVAGGGALATHFRIAEENNGRVLEKYTNENKAFTVGDSEWDNYEVSARVKAVGHNALPGIAARADDSGQNFYTLRIHNGENALGAGNTGYVALGRVVNGSPKELGGAYRVPYPFEPGKWYQLRLIVNGNQLKGYMDDRLIFDVVDDGKLFEGNPAPLAKGKAGLRIANNVSRIDDFTIHQLGDDSQADTVKPVITLLGQAEATVLQGSEYTDAGATAWDNVDGDLSDSIETTGHVDTAVPGVYIIRYNVSDAAGNAAEEVIRTVTVVAQGGEDGKPFLLSLEGELDRSRGIGVKAQVAPREDGPEHEGLEVVYFQLLKGQMPVAYVALKSNVSESTVFAAYFDVADPDSSAYSVHVFVVDELYPAEGSLPVALSDKLIAR